VSISFDQLVARQRALFVLAKVARKTPIAHGARARVEVFGASREVATCECACDTGSSLPLQTRSWDCDVRHIFFPKRGNVWEKHRGPRRTHFVVGHAVVVIIIYLNEIWCGFVPPRKSDWYGYVLR
jgi:hypothetical protein